MGRGILFFKRHKRVAEGWWNGENKLIYGRYSSKNLNCVFQGHMDREIFDGESEYTDVVKNHIYKGCMKQDKYEGFGYLKR